MPGLSIQKNKRPVFADRPPENQPNTSGGFLVTVARAWKEGFVTQQVLLQPKEAARILRIHPGTLRRWRGTGKGPAAIRIAPRTWRYRIEDVLRQQTAAAVTVVGGVE